MDMDMDMDMGYVTCLNVPSFHTVKRTLYMCGCLVRVQVGRRGSPHSKRVLFGAPERAPVLLSGPNSTQTVKEGSTTATLLKDACSWCKYKYSPGARTSTFLMQARM